MKKRPVLSISIVSVFPEFTQQISAYSIIKRACENKLVRISSYNLRDYASDKRRTVDDRPYGGGPGMIFRVDILYRALSALKKTVKVPRNRTRIILLDPRAEVFTQNTARRLTNFSHLIIVCGHYEGIDERVNEYIDEKLSIGKFILTGGELAAMMICDSVVRLIPGVLQNDQSVVDETFSDGDLAEYPQFTRPVNFRNKSVPEILLSGNHARIDKWRRSQMRRAGK